MSSFLAALLDTAAKVTSVGLEASGVGQVKKKGKGPTCTPCAVQARVRAVKAGIRK